MKDVLESFGRVEAMMEDSTLLAQTVNSSFNQIEEATLAFTTRLSCVQDMPYDQAVAILKQFTDKTTARFNGINQQCEKLLRETRGHSK